jgi:hypothetical protein
LGQTVLAKSGRHGSEPAPGPRVTAIVLGDEQRLVVNDTMIHLKTEKKPSQEYTNLIKSYVCRERPEKASTEMVFPFNYLPLIITIKYVGYRWLLIEIYE